MPVPIQFVILGASGDLTARKLVPGILDGVQRGLYSAPVSVVGVARRPWDDASFQMHLGETMPGRQAEIASLVRYIRTDLEQSQDFAFLARQLGFQSCQRVFYLAVKPDLILPSVEGLAQAGLLSAVNGLKARVVVEKPFGTDLVSAQALNCRLTQLLDEDQLYRIDHYLGKETVQNILALRFRNALFEPLWRTGHVELVQMTVAEEVGMPLGRGGYYDASGAVRDILQNHLMQLLSLIGMEAPASLDADDIRSEKAKVLKSLRPLTEAEQPAVTVVRGQYQGYRQESGVAPDSQTETFVAVRALIDTWRWGKVPFYLRTGKRMASRFSSIRIQFAMPPHNLFGSYSECHLRPNAMHLRLQPTEGIDLHFEAKKPGPGMQMQPVRMHFDYPEAFETSSAEAYQRLLSDVASGDQGLFIRSDEVELSWRFADSVRSAMAQTPLHFYVPGSMGPEAQHALFGPCEGRWATD